MNKSKLLITGTAGFIFSNFVRNLIFDKAPYEIYSIDKISSKNVLNNIYYNKNHTFHIGDITDAHFVDVIFDYIRPDYVIHGAAEANVDFSLNDPNKFITSNVLGTQILLNASVNHKVKKFIQVSSDEIYGQLNLNESAWTEESIVNPRNPYAASKAAAEMLVKAAGESFGLNYNITRCCNNFGPRQTTDKLIPRTIKAIIEQQPIPIYGQGNQVRDWLYVNDHYSAIMKVLESGVPGEVYNISANQEFSNIEVVQQICNIMNQGWELITHIPDPRGNAHDFRYAINADKVKKLGWKPSYKFKDGLKICVEWYNNNRSFIR